MCGKIINTKFITPRVVSPRLVTPKTIMSVAGSAKPKPIPEPDALNFYMPDGGTITLTRNGTPTVVELEYSIDGGATWQIWEEVGNVRSLTLAAGGKMYVRNTSATSTGFSTKNADSYHFSFTNTTESGGNLDSLLCKNPAMAIHTSWCFTRLFYNEKLLVKAPELVQMNLAMSSYNSLLAYTSIKEIVLYAKIIPQFGYYNLLSGSTMVSKITTYMTDVSSEMCLSNWVYRVAATGDFYCPAELTIPTGDSGIPSGWTRHDI